MDQTFLNSQQLAKRYGVTAETVRTWHRRGLIPAMRATRKPLLFDTVEVDAALRARARQQGVVA